MRLDIVIDCLLTKTTREAPVKYWFVNPFLIFVASIFSSFLLYQTGLSALYSGGFSIADAMMCFVLVVGLFAGIFLHRFLRQKLPVERPVDLPKNNLLFLVAFSLLFFAVEVIYAGGLPILYVLQGEAYDYTQFGVPTLHVAFLGYYSVAAVVSYERYLSTRSKQYLIPVALAIFYNVSIVNRGALLITLASLIFMYMYNARHKIRMAFTMTVLLILITIAFGYIGDKRMVSSGYQNADVIYDIGQADPIFRALPTGFFWVYIYASSTYANLVAQEPADNIDKGSIPDLINFAVLPDFISKHIIEDKNAFAPALITPELKVSTAFGRAFVISGYGGIVTVAFWYSLIVWLTLYANRNKMLLSACGVLCSVSLFMSFDNMLVFASFVLQIIILSLYSRLRIGRYRLL